MASTRFWLAVGTPENWHTAFDYGGIWGLKETQRRFWEAINENLDLLFFYVTTPVSGVVGYGLVRHKLHQPSPLWPEERGKNKIIWPLRLEFDVLGALPPNTWTNQRIDLPELKARARSGFQEVGPAVAQELLQSLPGAKPEELVLAPPVGLRAAAIPKVGQMLAGQSGDLHTQAKRMLVEIGRLQSFVADPEFPIENRRLDVVWRRVQRAVPSYVFEIQVSGNLTEALGKLKQAHQLWNSSVFLVGKEEHRAPANQLLASTFPEIQSRLRFLDLSQVDELYQKKQAYREMERRLGILP